MASPQVAFEVVKGQLNPDPFIGTVPCWQHTEEFLLGADQYTKEAHNA